MLEGTGRGWGWLYKFGPTLNRRPKNQEDLNPEEDNCIGCSPRKAMTNLDSILRSRDIIFPTKVYSQSYDFSSSHVHMYELDHKEGRVFKS